MPTPEQPQPDSPSPPRHTLEYTSQFAPPSTYSPQAPPPRPTIYLASKTAYLTPTIIAINLAIYLAMGIAGVGWFDPDALKTLAWGADYAPLSSTGQYWRLFTSAFIHFGIIHVAFNMFALYQVGSLTEKLFGKSFYFLIYFFGCLGSGIASAFHDLGISAGASGAIFAVYGALFTLLFIQRKTFPSSVFQPLIKSTGIFIAYNIFYGLSQPEISNAAHIGGLITGIILGFIAARPLDPIRQKRQAIPRLLATTLAGLLITSLALKIPKDYQAVNDLGAQYEDGDQVPQNYPLAYAYFLRAANGGNGDAMYNLGSLTENGKGTPKDPSKANDWYLKSANTGNADAMFKLALSCDFGYGAPKDPAQARIWYQKAADAGNVDAMNNLGVYCRDGTAGPVDYAQAMILFQKAADQKDALAMYNVATLYDNGLGVPQDGIEAQIWYKKAADAGDPDAKKILANQTTTPPSTSPN